MRKEVLDYIKLWEGRCYKNGLPDEVPSEIADKVPSYKNIVKAIFRNDVELLGVIKKPCSAYISLKRIEISKRPETKLDAQLKMF